MNYEEQSGSFISCYNQKTRKLEIFKVPHSVSIYVRQLESYIKYPEHSKLMNLYGFRLKNKPVIKPEKKIYSVEDAYTWVYPWGDAIGPLADEFIGSNE